MIHREKDFSNPPADLVDSEHDTTKKQLLTEKNSHKVKSSIYRDTTLNELIALYDDKCAICERKRGDELEVDHYRPKKKRENKTAKKYNHPGYYWLAYEWSNLIPLCSKCNSKKSNKFPLLNFDESNRAVEAYDTNGNLRQELYDPKWLFRKEKPLLINPEIFDKPQVHVKYLPDATIQGRTEEGKETIKTLKLNRKSLRRDRKEVLIRYIDGIKSAISDFSKNKNKEVLKGELIATFKLIHKGRCPSHSFSLFHQYIYQYFDDFIVSQIAIPDRGKRFLSKSFNDFKQARGRKLNSV